MKIKNIIKKLSTWNTCLVAIIVLTITAGLILMIKSNESSNNIFLGLGTGLISSGIVSLMIELSHIISNSTKTNKLKEVFYSDVKSFISEFLFYASFYLKKNDLNTIDMLNHQSNTYKQKARKFKKVSEGNKDKILDDIHYLVKQRKNFKLLLSKLNNEKFNCVIHGIIDIETDKILSDIIYDYSWITECFNDNNSLGVIPDAYSNLLRSVAILIEKDNNLKAFRMLTFYSSNNKTLGYIGKKDFKKLSKQDKLLLHEYEIK